MYEHSHTLKAIHAKICLYNKPTMTCACVHEAAMPAGIDWFILNMAVSYLVYMYLPAGHSVYISCQDVLILKLLGFPSPREWLSLSHTHSYEHCQLGSLLIPGPGLFGLYTSSLGSHIVLQVSNVYCTHIYEHHVVDTLYIQPILV